MYNLLHTLILTVPCTIVTWIDILFDTKKICHLPLPEMEPGGSGIGNGNNGGAGSSRRFNFPGNGGGGGANKQPAAQQQNVDSKSANNLNKDGNESPESGSLYSDEIPSGYNSGEQYDTISCGYMSGEAYELPDTRMELREPALEVIEECIQPLGTFANSDQDIFRMPAITMGKFSIPL